MASKGGILSSKEIKELAIKNHDRYIDLIRYVNSTEIAKLQEEGHIYNRKTREECKRPIVMDDKIYDDVKKLYELKLFLENFSLVDTNETFDVHLWEDYLMYAYLFGIVDKVLKQFKNCIQIIYMTWICLSFLFKLIVKIMTIFFII